MIRRACLSALLFAPLAFAAPVPKELKKDDLALLAGEWETVRAEFNGREYNKDYLTFTRENVNWKTSRDGGDILWKLTVDPAKSPKEFEIQLGNGVKYLGFYKLEGDTLTLACKQNVAPTGFNSDAGTYLHELRRIGGK